MPASGLALSIPFYVFASTTENLLFAAIGLIIGGFVKYGYIAAQYTIGQGVVTMRVRAMAIAVLLFIANLIGYGFGPLFIGLTSDIFFVNGVTELGVAAEALARNQGDGLTTEGGRIALRASHDESAGAETHDLSRHECRDSSCRRAG